MSDGLKASGSRKRSAMELSKALAVLGYGTWNNLEPGKTRTYLYGNRVQDMLK